MAGDRDAVDAAEGAYLEFRRFFAGDREALRAARRALARIPDRPSATVELAQQLNSLGADLRRESRDDADPDTLDAAIEAYEKAFAVCPPASEDRRFLLSSLSQGLTDRFDRHQDPRDADRAVEAATEAIRDLVPGARWAPQLYLGLLRALTERSHLPDDLAEAVRAERALRDRIVEIGVEDSAMAAALDEAAAMPRYHLGRMLLGDAGGVDDGGNVDRAIELMRAAAAMEPMLAADLVYALTRRYRRSGHLDDIREAVRTGEAALAALEPAGATPPAVIAALHRNVGIARRARYVVDPEPDSHATILAFEGALAASAPSAERRFYDLVNLANMLADRHGLEHERADLDHAIELYEEALKAAPATGEEHEIVLLDHAQTLVDRYRLDRAPDDIRSAIAAFEHGLTVFHDGPMRPGILANLGGAIEAIEAGDRRPEDLARGVAAFREAATTASSVAPTETVRIARAWGRWASEREAWPEAAEAYRLGIDAMVRLVGAQSDRSDRETWLAAARGMPAAGAYATIQAGDPSGAVALLERGRAVLLSLALGSSRETTLGSAAEDLATAKAQEHVAYIAAAPAGGLALVFEPGARPSLRHVALPELDGASLDRVILAYVEAYERRDEDREAWMAVLDQSCRWLWTAAIGPLFDAIRPSRLVIVPVGWLGLLPLHAAWRDDRDGRIGRHYALDDATWLNTPSIRVLREARSRTRGGAGSVLVVDDPQPVSAPVLRFAAREAEFALGGSSTHVRLRKHRARFDDVRAALEGADRMHFACHALADLLDPLRSGLVLAGDERLMLGDIQGLNLHAELAVLSACETAMTGLKLADEVVGLPAGLLEAGVHGVVGSTWSVNDLSTLLVMARFYDGLRDEGLDAPDALRQAQRWVRDATNGEKAARYPDIAGLQPGMHLGPAARAFWERARMHAHPYHWAGFVYVGA